MRHPVNFHEKKAKEFDYSSFIRRSVIPAPASLAQLAPSLWPRKGQHVLQSAKQDYIKGLPARIAKSRKIPSQDEHILSGF